MAENVIYQVDMQNIKKNFGGVAALSNGRLQVKKGEIHALMGENGAGKSTLMKILAGSLKMDSGEIKINGQHVEIKNPKDGMNNGISIIYQELMLIPDLTVAENIFIDVMETQHKVIDWAKLREEAQKYLNDTGFSMIKANDEVSYLTVAHQQVVEICKALSRNAAVLILDEPTSVLSNNEVVHLFRLLRQLRDNGVAIIYISHRLEEVMELCDRVTIMRDGNYIETVDTQSITKQQLANMMVGRDLQDYYPARNAKIGEVCLKVEHIKAGNRVRDVSFEVHKGEVLGISGLVGAGRTEAMRAIYGIDKKDGGKIFIDGQEVKIHSSQDAVKAGIVLLSEDRKLEGVLLDLSIAENITLGCLKKFKGLFGALNSKKEQAYIQSRVEQLTIKVGNVNNDVSSLSGGNQQKVAIAKMLARDAKILILDEPTRGVDVGAKREIYKIINEFAENGYSVVMISSEMPEVIGLCDRAIIMRCGEVTGELSKKELTEQNLITFAMDVL